MVCIEKRKRREERRDNGQGGSGAKENRMEGIEKGREEADKKKRERKTVVPWVVGGGRGQTEEKSDREVEEIFLR